MINKFMLSENMLYFIPYRRFLHQYEEIICNNHLFQVVLHIPQILKVHNTMHIVPI